MAFTAADVRAIAPAIPATLDIDPFIVTATLITGQLNDYCGNDFTDDHLDQIGIYLTAHYVYMAEGTGVTGAAKSESIAKGDYSRTNEVAKMDDGIMGTTYGQMANQLSFGFLANFDQPQPLFFDIGTNP